MKIQASKKYLTQIFSIAHCFTGAVSVFEISF